MTGNISLVEAAILQANLLQILETNNADEAASKLPVVEARLDLLREDMAKQSAVITSIDQELFARAKKEKSISSSFKRMSFKVKRKSVGDDAKVYHPCSAGGSAAQLMLVLPRPKLSKRWPI